MNKTLSMFTYLPVATLLISACSTMRAGEYTAGWSENQTPEVIKLSNGFSLRYLRAGRGRPLVLLHTIRTQLDYFEQLGVTARNGIYSTLRDRETSKINHLNSIVSSRFRTFIRCSHRTVTY